MNKLITILALITVAFIGTVHADSGKEKKTKSKVAELATKRLPSKEEFADLEEREVFLWCLAGQQIGEQTVAARSEVNMHSPVQPFRSDPGRLHSIYSNVKAFVAAMELNEREKKKVAASETAYAQYIKSGTGRLQDPVFAKYSAETRYIGGIGEMLHDRDRKDVEAAKEAKAKKKAEKDKKDKPDDKK